MRLTQILLTVFLSFALSRVFLRFRSGEVNFTGLVFWSAIFSCAIIAVLFPDVTTNIAQTFGIGRGVDAVLYISIAVLFYLVFRLYVYLQDIRQEITALVQKIALKEMEKKHEKKSSKD